VFQGNELIFGTALANWLLLTGFGAFIGRFSRQIRDPEAFYLFLMLLLSVIPILTILKLDIWRSVVFPAGYLAGLKEIFYTSLLIQTPVCFLSGFLFTGLSSLLQPGQRSDLPGYAYAVESFGSMLAGIMINFVLLWTIGSFFALKILSAGYLITVILFAFSMSRWVPRIITPLAVFVILWGLFSFSFKDFSLSMLFEGETVHRYLETPYGRVIITGNAGQENVYENGVLLFSSGNVIRDEESVHFAMIQHRHPERVLLISGGLSGAIPEIRKYSPEVIDYVELNPALTELFSAEDNDGVTLINTDARRYLQKTRKLYDIILMKLPEPANLQLNRYYTNEFFRVVHQRLTPGGVFSLSLPTGSDYVTEEAGNLHSSLYNTLRKHFSHVLILPSGQNYFLASDSALTTDIPSRIGERNIPTDYVNPWYFDEKLLKDRSRFMHQHVDASVEINHDFHPVAYFYQQSYWLSQFRENYILIAGITVLLLVFTFFSLTSVNAGLFSAGFTSASTEIILLFGFQVMFGYIYQALGILIMVFMMGLATGAGFRKWILPGSGPRTYVALQLSLAAVVLVILVFFSLIPFFYLHDALVFAVFLLLIMAVAFVTGMEFSLAGVLSRGNTEKVIAFNYSADLYGSALGALLTAVVLIPLAGFFNTLLLLAILNTATALFFLLKNRTNSG